MRPLLFIAVTAVCGCAQTPYATAMTEAREGRFSEAIPILEKLLSQSPGDSKARNLLGIALMNTARREEARAQFQKALAIDSNFLPALKNLAIDEMALGLAAEAEGHFLRLLKSTPDDPVAHLYLGEIEFGKAIGAGLRPAQALEHYRHSGGLHLKDPAVALHFARAALAAGETPEAEQALAALPAEDYQRQFEAGILLSEAHRFAAAASHFERAAKGPDRYAAAFNFTLVEFDAGNFATAIASGAELARTNPTAELYNLLSRAYEASGKTQPAYDALRTATKLEPAS